MVRNLTSIVSIVILLFAVNISASAVTDQTKWPDIKDFELSVGNVSGDGKETIDINFIEVLKETMTPVLTIPQDNQVFFEYDIPDKLYTGTVFIMHCILHKGNLSGKLSLRQRLPNNFTILDIKIPDANTKINHSTLIIDWDAMPPDSVIDLKYKIQINQQAGYLPIFTILRFHETGKRYVFDTHVDIDKIPVAGEPVSQKDIDAINKAIRETAKYATMASTAKPVGGIVYRIQIMALKKHNYAPDYLQGKYNIDKTVQKETVDNWNKYIVGEFNTLYDAQQYRNELKGYGIIDAFIVCLLYTLTLPTKRIV
jgi:hypothetical protein